MEVKNDVKDLQKRMLKVAILTGVMIILCIVYRFFLYDSQQGFFYFMVGSVIIGCIAFIYISTKTKEKVLFKITDEGIEFIEGKFPEMVKFDQIIRLRCDAMVGLFKAKDKEFANIESFANKPPIPNLGGILRFDTVNGFHDYENVANVMEVVVKLLPHLKKTPIVTYSLGKKEVKYTYFKKRNPNEPIEFYIPKAEQLNDKAKKEKRNKDNLKNSKKSDDSDILQTDERETEEKESEIKQ